MKGEVTSRMTDLVEKVAAQVLEVNNMDKKSGKIPIVRLANNYGIICSEAGNMPEILDANMFIGGNTIKAYQAEKVIIVDGRLDLNYKRYLVANQFAYYLFNYIGRNKGNNEYMERPIERAFLHGYQTSEDRVVNRLANALILPVELFMRIYIQVYEIYNRRNLTITYLSIYFRVPEIVIEQRMEELGLCAGWEAQLEKKRDLLTRKQIEVIKKL